jgi:hypothetical protein
MVDAGIQIRENKTAADCKPEASRLVLAGLDKRLRDRSATAIG